MYIRKSLGDLDTISGTLKNLVGFGLPAGDVPAAAVTARHTGSARVGIEGLPRPYSGT